MCEVSSKSAHWCRYKMLWQTDRQTDRQTDAQTDLIPGVNIFSYEMTEYKKPLWHLKTDFYKNLKWYTVWKCIRSCLILLLNKIVEIMCVIKQTENVRFFRFSVILLGTDATDAKNMAIFVVSDSKSLRSDILYFILRNFKK